MAKNLKFIKNYDQLINLRKKFIKYKIGLCHGAFDILHHGHLLHLSEAKKSVDKLVVSITADKYIQKGPYQPYNDQFKRAEFLSFINVVDYVFIDENITSEKTINSLKPNFYFKGQDYLTKDITGNLNKEINILKKNKGKIKITKTKLMSSTKILNNKFINISKEQYKYLKYFKSIDGFKRISNAFKKIEKLRINIIGEPIIDTYVFGEIKGLTSKDPTISILREKQINLAGGVMAVANMASQFVNKVDLYTYGKNLKSYLKKNDKVNIINFDKTQTLQKKTRFINSNRYEKLLQVTNISKNIISEKKYKKINIKNKNLLICDFGVGLFNNYIVSKINNLKIKKFVNVQTNSINYGKNIFTKYDNCEYISLDKREWEIVLQNKELNYKNLIKFFKNKPLISITRGKQGSSLLTNKYKYDCPVYISKTIDTTGCGDAYFLLTSLLILINFDKKLIPFLGNIYAGMHAQNLGNSKVISKIEFLKYLKSITSI